MYRRAYLCIALLLGTACSSFSVHSEVGGEYRDDLVPSVTARWDLRGRDAGPDDEGKVVEGKVVEGIVGLILGLEAARTEVRGLAGSTHIGRIDGAPLATSDLVSSYKQMHEGPLASPAGMRFDSVYHGGLTGLGSSDQGVDVGGVLGAGPEANMTDWLDVYGRLATLQGPTYASFGSDAREELGIRVRIAPQVEVATAYSWWTNMEGESAFHGEGDMKAERLLVAFELRF